MAAPASDERAAMPDISCRRLCAVAMLVGCVTSAQQASASTAYALTTNNILITFDTASPGTIPNAVAITFFPGGEQIVAIDVRPETGELIGLGSSGALYRLDPEGGSAVPISAAVGSFGGASFGFDFDPVADRARLVSDTGQNLRVDLNTGAVVSDTSLSPGPAWRPLLTRTATRLGPTSTTLYGIDSATDTLVLQMNRRYASEPQQRDRHNRRTARREHVRRRWLRHRLGESGVRQPDGWRRLRPVCGRPRDRRDHVDRKLSRILPGAGSPRRRPFTPRPERCTASRAAAPVDHVPQRLAGSHPPRTVPITGLQAGETIVGLDQDSRTLELYAVGSSSAPLRARSRDRRGNCNRARSVFRPAARQCLRRGRRHPVLSRNPYRQRRRAEPAGNDRWGFDRERAAAVPGRKCRRGHVRACRPRRSNVQQALRYRLGNRTSGDHRANRFVSSDTAVRHRDGRRSSGSGHLGVGGTGICSAGMSSQGRRGLGSP